MPKARTLQEEAVVEAHLATPQVPTREEEVEEEKESVPHEEEGDLPQGEEDHVIPRSGGLV